MIKSFFPMPCSVGEVFSGIKKGRETVLFCLPLQFVAVAIFVGRGRRGLPPPLRSFARAVEKSAFFLAKYDENTPYFILLFAFFSVQYMVVIYKVGKNT